MRPELTRAVNRVRTNFGTFTSGQKVVSIVGTVALLLAGFALFRWASAPSYAPLYTNLSSADAAGVVDQLQTEGVPYKLTGGGGTVMVPRDQVYESRIAMSAKGLPADTESGYSILDSQGLSTSQFQEQTDFKRAMEGELANTIEAINGVETAVVHLAMPQKEVFAKEQKPATASVLVKTAPGSTLQPEQVQAVINLVAASVDSLEPDKVTVADSTGKVLSVNDATGGISGSRDQQVQEFQDRMSGRLQTMLDRVLGPDNSTVQVTADLSFDQTVTEETRYFADPSLPPLASTETKEKYQGAGSGVTGATGVVGPEGGFEPGAGTTDDGSSTYSKKSTANENAVGQTTERREAAPGGLESLHVGVVIDSRMETKIDPVEIRNLVRAAVGIDTERGDTVQVAALPFDRSVEEAAAKEMEEAEATAAAAGRMDLYRNGGIGLAVLLVALFGWRRSRKAAADRREATSYVVEQLRLEALDRAAAAQAVALETPPALAALEAADNDLTQEMRDEIAALVERQPEDVATLLRGWLVEPPR